jgi:UDP-N-acetylmuramoyl-tripeptide--D-alanyl-D-alanine ligase
MTLSTLSGVAEAVGGRLEGADRSFESISTDTRTIGPGQLFFALRGERFDAADFVAEAASRGAAGAVVERIAPAGLSQVEVGDSRLALGALARKWREKMGIPVIGITGSNGKTTVKELTASIMRSAMKEYGDDVVLATRGNLNNDIGLPLTLLSLRDYHQAAVVEMGANHPGDIAVLADIAEVNVAVITNAARAHLEGFGSLEDVARTKGELLDSLAAGDTAVLHRDDPFFAVWAERIGPARLVSFGLSADADYRAVNVRQSFKDGGQVFEFELVSPAGTIEVILPLAGKHNVVNALAAAAAAMAAGAGLKDVRAGLEASRNVPGRLRAFRAATGAMIYDDSYNANPDSVTAAIALLEELDGEPWLVLGDMGELGPDAAALHFGMGELARDAGIRRLYCVGELSRETAAGFGKDARWFASVQELAETLRKECLDGRNILIKGSRFMGLDQLVRLIEADVTGAGDNGAEG